MGRFVEGEDRHQGFCFLNIWMTLCWMRTGFG